MERDTEFDSPIAFQPGIFSFLDLPFEIRLKIYGYLFRCEAPICPRFVYRGMRDGSQGTQARNDDGFKESLMRLPVELFRVNQQIYKEASTVMWSENCIVLILPTTSILYVAPNTIRQYGRVLAPSDLHGVCSPHPKDLVEIRHLIIEIYGTRPHWMSGLESPLLANDSIRETLSNISDVLNQSHNLQRLEIKFTNIADCQQVDDCFIIQHGVMAPGGVGAPYPVDYTPVCCNLFGYHVLGKYIQRIGEIQRLCQQAIEVDQQILTPLGTVRGVKEVIVSGRVTDEWAQYLTMSIQSARGVEVVAFKHSSAAEAVADIDEYDMQEHLTDSDE